MSWIEKRENGYRLVVEIKENQLGKVVRKRKIKNVNVNSKEQAELELAKFIVELEEKE